MEKRNRNYVRRMRAKHIKRKKNIVKNIYRWDHYYPHDGQYSKGKIHCSCPMCNQKTRHRRGYYVWGCTKGKKNWKHSDYIKVIKMDYDEVECG